MSSNTQTWITDNIVREQIRVQWESDFKKNYKAFAHQLGSSISDLVLKQIIQTNRDPYKNLINFDHKYTVHLKLDITDSDAIKEIMSLIKIEEAPAPFNVWIRKFSVEQKESNHADFENGASDDKEYFTKPMHSVALATEKVLKAAFFELQSTWKDLKFEVKWSGRLNQESSYGGSRGLNIALWLETPAQLQERMKECKSQRRMYIGIAVVIVIIAAIIYKTGIAKNINFPIDSF